jgi:16S rRNA (guanine527-N7)-methyltransferase
MKNRLIHLLNDGLIDLDSDFSIELAAEKLILYLMEWKRWNTKINLTAESDELSIINKHIYESLQYARVIPLTGLLADIGSGGGFPAIPIKIIRPKVEIDLIESQRKRANFLKTAIRSINLSNIECFHGRVADFPEFVGKYDFVTLRHVVEPNLSLKLGASLLRVGGSLILQTSRDHFFQLDFLNSLWLSAVDEIFFEGPQSLHSKAMVFKRIIS